MKDSSNPDIDGTKDGRSRNWLLVVYPESAPEDWVQQLESLGCMFVRSPLHDKDKNADGTPKKPHWHLLLSWRGKKSYEQILLVSKCLNSPIPQRCHDTRGAVRYMLHLDNPEKAPYAREDLLAGGGFDLDSALKLTTSEEGAILTAIEQFLFDNEIKEYADLVRSAKEEWRFTIRHNTLHLNALIRSIRHSITGS